jgi:hypothetical protein
MDDLKTLLPASVEFEFNGESVTVRPYTFGQMLKVLPHFGLLSALLSGQLDAGLMMECGESCLELISIATGKSRGFVEGLDPAQGLELLGAIVEVNGDFFLQRLRPSLENLIQKVERLGSSAKSLTETTGPPKPPIS